MKLSSPNPEDEDDLAAFWLITYSDMTTLLLAFFLVIYAFTVLGEHKKEKLIDALNMVDSGGDVTEVAASMKTLETAAEEIAAMLGKDATGEKPWVKATEAEVTVGLPASITFASGQAELTTEAEGHLRRAAALLADIPNPIRVEGHTDNVPVGGGVFKSNWQLSVARAQSVVRLFMSQGLDPRDLQVVGYADTRPLQTNDTSEGRRANRRIEIQLIRTEEDATKEQTE